MFYLVVLERYGSQYPRLSAPASGGWSVGYVAQNSEHLKGLAGSRLGPSGVRHQVADALECAPDQRGRAIMS